jgi:tRNA-dihydrouridine synthase B
MEFSARVPKGSLIFAPMEGITDGPYRMAIEEAFPEWNYLSTDFLRIPSQGLYSNKKILEHFGVNEKSWSKAMRKTSFQILTTMKSSTAEHVSRIQSLGIEHLDLNVGCPSKKVNGHLGGAYLLNDLPSLAHIVREIRTHFDGVFTAKIRIGYHNDKDFLNILKLLENEGVDAVTLHARTRDQLYEGKADWSYIRKAVENISIPLIGNGDCWSLHDIAQMFEQTGCHAIMMGRGALKTPWMATLYEEYRDQMHNLNDEYIHGQRKSFMDYYFHLLERNYIQKGFDDDQILKRFKSFSRYLFDDYENPEVVRSRFLRSRKLSEFKGHLETLH